MDSPNEGRVVRNALLSALLAFAVLAGCSNGGREATTTSFEAIPGVPDRPAIEVVEEMLAAMEAADESAVFGYHHPNAVLIPFEGEPFSLADSRGNTVEDFDGDGVATSADVIQWNFAMRGPWGEKSTWDCSEVDESRVECAIVTTNDVVGTGPDLDWVETQSFRVEGGLIVEVRSTSDPEYNAVADARMVRELFAYERWVKQEHPEQWDILFREPCCNLYFRHRPDSIAMHQELMAGFIAGR
jgi:hypothetical protein